MSVRNLEALFAPATVAVIGASTTPGRVGAVVMRNLLAHGFGGAVMPVNPKHRAVAGVLAYPDVASLPVAPDLAVICTPPATVPGLIADLGRRGTRAAVVLTAGIGGAARAAMLEAARPTTLRILGPNCVGLMVPGRGLDASFAHIAAAPGRIAFVSQSGAFCTVVLDWAAANGIGFSHFVSLGDCADVDFGDVLDWLAGEAGIDAILLYIEGITGARKFMSAARAAARSRPVIALKAGRAAEGARAAASHTGAMAGADDVADSALRRAGILRVHTVEELFASVETLARAPRLAGERLAILTNGGGPAVLAADAIGVAKGTLAVLAPATIAALDRVLPATWSKGNPVDIIGDAQPDRYASAMAALQDDPGIDALLVLNAPTAIASSMDATKAVAQAAKAWPRPVLTCWLGGALAEAARGVFAEAGIATYPTPESAVQAFLHMAEHRRNQALLMEVPPATPSTERPQAARAIVEAARAAGRNLLGEAEAKEVLAAYGIPVVPTRVVADVAEARAVADSLGYPVALKIRSPEISHKTDVGGVALDLEDGERLARAAEEMLARVARLRPGATVEGFTVQPMARRPKAVELIAGLARDPVFGPIVLVGHGGVAVEAIGDRAIGLPPLSVPLARAMIARTRVARLLAGYRDRPPADLDGVAATLVRLSLIAVELPEVAELDINPLWADSDGVLALDARILLGPPVAPAIRPYPTELEERAEVGGRALLLRPIRPEDEPAHRRFLARLAPEDVRSRFFGLVREPGAAEMARLTQIDYEREMAFVAVAEDGAIMGVARAVSDPDGRRAEFAIVVRSDAKGEGLGTLLLGKLVRYLKARGVAEVVGQTMRENRVMQALARDLGFQARTAKDDPGIVELRLELGA